MSDAKRLPGLLRLAPLIAAAALTATMVGLAYTAISPHAPPRAGAGMGLAVVALGFVAAQFATSGLSILPRTLAREIFGAAFLILGLFALWTLAALNVLPRDLPPWELVIASVAGFMFFLGSQRSFLLLAGLDAFVVLVALLFADADWRTFGGAAGFCAVLLVLLAVLFHREKLEETATAGRTLDAWLPLRSVPAVIGACVFLFGIFFAVRPGESLSLAEIWAERKVKTSSRPGGGRLDRAMASDPQDDPFAGRQASRLAQTSSGASIQVPWLSFERDLKFGDRADTVHPETVLMYVQVRDATGAPTEGKELPLYWTTAAVSRYDGREWTADTASGRLVLDRDDGASDGRVTLRPAPPSVPAAMIEQRVILLPLSSRSLFAAYPVVAIGLDRVMVDREEMLSRAQPYEGRFRYSAWSRVASPDRARLERAPARHRDGRYLEVPTSFLADARVREIVRDISGRSLAAVARIDAVMQHLAEYRYTLTPSLRPDADPTLEFLRLRRGYCQHFASAAALLLRGLNVPARICVGFTRGDWNETDEIYVVRRKHAHSWVEIHFEGIGWVPLDPAGQPLAAFQSGAAVETPEPARVEPPKPADPPKPANPSNPSNPSDPSKDPAPPDPAKKDPAPPPIEPPRPRDPSRPADPPLPPTRRADPMEGPAGQRTEFERLWDSVDNRPADPLSMSAAGGAGARGDGDGGGPGVMSRVASAAGSMLWTIVRDLILVLAAAALVYVAIVWFLRRRRAKSAASRPGAMGEERFLDEAPVGEPDRVLPDSLPRGSRRRRLVELYLDLLLRLKALGFARAGWQTPWEFLAVLGERLIPCPAGLRTLTDYFVEARYGAAEPDENRVAAAEHAQRSALADLKRVR